MRYSAILLAGGLAACGGGAPPAAQAGKPPAHEHHAPHGGLLVEIGEEFSHVELVLDPEQGALTAYTLDGEAENPVRVAQKSLTVRFTAPAKLTMTLAARANSLTGETVGDTSEFFAKAPRLKTMLGAKGSVLALRIKGSDFKDLPFGEEKGEKGGTGK